MISEHFFGDRDSLSAALSMECQLLLSRAVSERGSASFLVSGGSTPQPLYRKLATAELPWRDVSVALVDERWVEPGADGSNETFVRDNLLQQRAAEAHYIATKNGHASAAAGLAECERAYAALPRPFDLAILGMGPDGHTASLFPHAHGLETALDLNRRQLCAAIEAIPSTVTGALIERMTLSLYGLLQSRQLHLMITGEEKLQVYRTARDNDDLASMPISAVLRQERVPVSVYWAP